MKEIFRAPIHATLTLTQLGVWVRLASAVLDGHTIRNEEDATVISGATYNDEAVAVRTVLQRCFVRDEDGVFRAPALERELEKIAARRARAKAAAARRWKDRLPHEINDDLGGECEDADAWIARMSDRVGRSLGDRPEHRQRPASDYIGILNGGVPDDDAINTIASSLLGMPGACPEHAASMPDACRTHAVSMHDACDTHAVSMPQACQEHARSIPAEVEPPEGWPKDDKRKKPQEKSWLAENGTQPATCASALARIFSDSNIEVQGHEKSEEKNEEKQQPDQTDVSRAPASAREEHVPCQVGSIIDASGGVSGIGSYSGRFRARMARGETVIESLTATELEARKADAKRSLMEVM